MNLRIVIGLCALLAGTNAASAAILSWGCQAQLGDQRVLFNRDGLYIVDGKAPAGKPKKFTADSVGDAITELKQAVALSEGSPVLMGQLGRAYGLSGAAAEANAVLAQLTALARREYVPSSAVALVHLGLGRNANALDLLDRAYDEHDFALVHLRVAPWFQSLRGDARYAQLAARMQLR